MTPGIHNHRLDPEQKNPKEIAFWEQWEKENKQSNLLELLFIRHVPKGTPGAKRIFSSTMASAEEYIIKPLGDVTERDEAVAGTIIQWLGSNIGISFLELALGKVGYRIIKE